MEKHSSPLPKHHLKQVKHIRGLHHPHKKNVQNPKAIIQFGILLIFIILGLGIIGIIATTPKPMAEKVTATPTPVISKAAAPTIAVQPTAAAVLPSPVPTLSADSTKDWQYYLNKKYAYSIKLPPYFVIDPNNSPEKSERMFFLNTEDTNAPQRIEMSVGYELYTKTNTPNLPCTTDAECYQILYRTVTYLKEDHAFPSQVMVQGRTLTSLEVDNPESSESKPSVEYYVPLLVNGKFFDFRFILRGYNPQQAKELRSVLDTIAGSLTLEAQQ